MLLKDLKTYLGTCWFTSVETNFYSSLIVLLFKYADISDFILFKAVIKILIIIHVSII